MKKLLAIVLALVTVVSMAVPVMAADPEPEDELTVTTSGSVNPGTNNAYMIALFSTPDEIPDNLLPLEVDPDGKEQVDIYLEPAIPNGVMPLFPPTNSTMRAEERDGWKRVKFYLIANHSTLTHSGINIVDVTVNYPDGTEKFQVNASKQGGVWTASQSGYAPVNYPVVAPGVPAEPATPPAANTEWQVRELQYYPGTDTFDKVDINGDCDTDDLEDLEVDDALVAWNCRVEYAEGWDAVSTATQLQLDQCLMLELQGFVWFHQQPLLYTYLGSANSSFPLTNHFQFVPSVSLFLDFNNVDFGQFNSTDAWVKDEADIYLSTPLKPTIWNNGNIDAEVLVANTKMVLNDDPANASNPAKVIDRFDAILYHTNETGVPDQVGQIEYNADAAPKVISNNLSTVPPELGPEGPVRLTACRPAKIEFSLRPNDHPILDGTYYGDIFIELEPFIE